MRVATAPINGPSATSRVAGRCLTARPHRPNITPLLYMASHPKANRHGRTEASHVAFQEGDAPQPPSQDTDPSAVLHAMQRTRAAAPRLPELRLLPEPGSRGDGS